MDRAKAISGVSAVHASACPVGVPLFHAAWLFAAGIATSAVVWAPPGMLLVSLAVAGAACACAAWYAPRMAWLSMAVLWALLGLWCAEMEPHPAPAPRLLALSDGLLRSLEGTVVASGPIRSEDQETDTAVTSSAESTERIDVRVSSIEVVDDAVDREEPVHGTVRITVRWPEVKNGVRPGTSPAATAFALPCVCWLRRIIGIQARSAARSICSIRALLRVRR